MKPTRRYHTSTGTKMVRTVSASTSLAPQETPPARAGGGAAVQGKSWGREKRDKLSSNEKSIGKKGR